MAELAIKDLTVAFPTRFGTFTAVRDVSLAVGAGRIHGLVGESGAGKSTVGTAIMGLIPRPGRIVSGSIRLDDMELTRLDDAAWHAVRGRRLAMVFQDPLTSLDPLFTVEDQLVETIREHLPSSAAEARDRALSLLRDVGIANAEARMRDYPHQFSGGMRQRVVIALAIAAEPEFIVADEPTTALDVSVQKTILALIRRLARDRGIGVIFVTHDIGVIAEVTDSVTVLYRGAVVETGTTAEVLGAPRHAYTQGLMAAVPRLGRRLARFPIAAPSDAAATRPDAAGEAAWAERWLLDASTRTDASATKAGVDALLTVDALSVDFGGARGWLGRRRAALRAVDAVSFVVHRGEVLGLVGESGSGKSTIAKAIVGLVRPTRGSVRYAGEALHGDRADRRAAVRRQVQMIFQDPYSSLNNRWRVGDIVAEPLRVYRIARGKREVRRIVAAVLALVGLDDDAAGRYPHQFSGGQRQRIAIARALVARPRLLICDEPTSALDVSIQAQILNLLKDLQQRLGLTMLFISHNLPVVRQMADRVLVLKDGAVVETGAVEDFFAGPTSAYGRRLLAETPSLALLNAVATEA